MFLNNYDDKEVLGLHFRVLHINLLTTYSSRYECRNYIGKLTGGVSASLEIISVKPTGEDDHSKVLPGTNMLTMLFIQGKCTIDKISDLFDIFLQIGLD